MAIFGFGNEDNGFFSSITEGVEEGIDASGQFIGGVAAQAIPSFTRSVFEGQKVNKVEKILFDESKSQPRIDAVGVTAKGPLGLSGEIDTTTVLLLGAIVVGGVILAVKL